MAAVNKTALQNVAQAGSCWSAPALRTEAFPTKLNHTHVTQSVTPLAGIDPRGMKECVRTETCTGAAREPLTLSRCGLGPVTLRHSGSLFLPPARRPVCVGGWGAAVLPRSLLGPCVHVSLAWTPATDLSQGLQAPPQVPAQCPSGRCHSPALHGLRVIFLELRPRAFPPAWTPSSIAASDLLGILTVLFHSLTQPLYWPSTAPALEEGLGPPAPGPQPSPSTRGLWEGAHPDGLAHGADRKGLFLRGRPSLAPGRLLSLQRLRVSAWGPGSFVVCPEGVWGLSGRPVSCPGLRCLEEARWALGVSTVSGARGSAGVRRAHSPAGWWLPSPCVARPSLPTMVVVGEVSSTN